MQVGLISLLDGLVYGMLKKKEQQVLKRKRGEMKWPRRKI